jgi:D-ribulokinase
MTTQKAYLGIDVGTGSARAGVFNASGKLLASAKRPIDIWHEAGEVVEQSSDQIWSAICESVRDAVSFAGVASTGVMGVGFDATCSLVAVKADGKPVAVGPSGNAKRNIMVWMDHRAAGEAEEINSCGHSVLRYVGGRISPEMETPKLLWLKRNLPESFSAADYFFDLADYLTWRATGSLDRSICTVTCKWTYLAHEKRWDAHYFDGIGLGELAAEGFTRIGTNIVEPGVALGKGLTNEAAADLGLQTGTPVAASLIDAHAGGVGTLGGQIKGLDIGVQRRLAYIFGTSACSMASSETCKFVDGVWGPYYSAMIPGLWLNEGGQSAAGAAIDHLVQIAVTLAKDIHVVPEFLGNRSPFAEPDARAIIAGLGLESDVESLLALYVAGLSGIGYGLKQLLNKFSGGGMPIDLIVASGGAAQSNLVCQMLADATNTPVTIANTPEPVMLGSAMLAAVAAGEFSMLGTAMEKMSGTSQLYNPNGGEIEKIHNRRFKAFEALQAAGRHVRKMV